MEIVMLGHSAAGKTSYMALMYELMHRGVNGFSVTAAQDGDHRRLMRDAHAIRAGRYPHPSDRRHEYALRLRHHHNPVFDFLWKDFRGAALTERSSSAQKRELHDDLLAADAIVLFVDLHDLLTDHRAPRKVRFLTVLVTEALGERTRPTPLVIACTKCDLVDPSADTTPFATAFAPMIDAVANSQHTHGTIVQLSCGLRPANVQGPVLFCLALGVRARAQQLHDAFAASLTSAQDAARRDKLWDRVSSSWKGERTWRSIAASRYAGAHDELRALEPLIEPSNRLLDEIGDLPHF
jgi:Double-GTPase 2